jgi:O-antigen/teichoic acid export membrane protein
VSAPFAVQDTFSVMLARMDTLILSVLATQAAVGRYGAAYRLFESSFLIIYALTAAFTALYTRLGPTSEPPLRFVFQVSIKAALVLLMPLAIAFVFLAGPVCSLIYGSTFASAAPLSILGPGVALMGVINLTVSLLVSNEDPRRVVALTGAVAALNIGLNLLLIPIYGDEGAAAAMLATEVIYAAWVMRRAWRLLEGLEWPGMLAGALVASAVMIATTLPLRGSLPAALAAGVPAYLVALLLVERRFSPLDVAFAARLVRRRLGARRSRSAAS